MHIKAITSLKSIQMGNFKVTEIYINYDFRLRTLLNQQKTFKKIYKKCCNLKIVVLQFNRGGGKW